ncbi:MAG: right-handed parallel beta-helix repeat-containing protein [Sedimentisphaerales bacterium]|nr:right-handed parallel beta-helix repeat-containing protein [Sedimentisphaerales bacterium]
MKRCLQTFCLIFAAALTASTAIGAEEITVIDSSQLPNALRSLKPGTTLLIAPGTYRGGLYLSNTSGTAEEPIVIRGADAENPPLFSGGSHALHLADCSYITLANLKVRGFPANGINIDDGGSFETPAHNITLENITILETGPQGNHDALKISGVDRFLIRRCRFEGWGGSGIDMVGCHNGVVEDCNFVGREGFSQSNAVQLKGGTRHILVQTSLFKNAGQRAINLGGSTGLQFFRPGAGDYEAKDIVIAGNRFIEGLAPVAWVTADGGIFHSNTIILPEKWVLRILQETKDPKFKPCHDGVFENNLVIYDSRVSVFVNVGPGTAPQTFSFGRNAWHNLDGTRKPSLPARETDAIYQPDIELSEESHNTGRIKIRDNRLAEIGAHAYIRPR